MTTGILDDIIDKAPGFWGAWVGGFACGVFAAVTAVVILVQ